MLKTEMAERQTKRTGDSWQQLQREETKSVTLANQVKHSEYWKMLRI